MSEKLYPERQRCKQCRKKLEQTVLKGLYCSYKCATHPTPPNTPDEAPRQCKRQVDGVWGWKTKYRFEKEVPERIRVKPETNIYLCDSCLFLHVGHSRLNIEDTTKLRRTIYDMKTLGSVIERRRVQLNWDKKVLAKDIKTIPIRITEIERGDTKIDMNVLFRLLNRLKIVVEIIER